LDAKSCPRSRTFADFIEREGRALVIGMNKWILSSVPRRTGLARETDQLPQLKACRSANLGLLTGEGVIG
jgi:hypothetical protein